MSNLLVIEDGDEYVGFVRALLPEQHCAVARNAAEALARASEARAYLIDLRFDRIDPGTLIGNPADVARELFGGDASRAARHLVDEQGIYILKALRAAGHDGRAVFVHDFASRRLSHLRALYGDVVAMPAFDASALRLALGGSR